MRLCQSKTEVLSINMTRSLVYAKVYYKRLSDIKLQKEYFQSSYHKLSLNVKSNVGLKHML